MVTWETINLVENSTLKARIGWQGLTTAEYLDEGYAYLITGTDFVNGKISWDTCHYVDKYRYDQDTNIQIMNGDILVTKDGTIGKIAIVSGLNRKATLNSGVFVIRPKKNAYDNVYAYYILLSDYFLEFLAKLAAGSTINHLYQKDFMNFEFPLPPLPEQRAIAAALSDVDGYIAALERLIVKKRNIKKGTMQELLTGKRRLPGFSGEWVEKELVKIADFYDNLRIPIAESKREAGTTPYYGANGIQGYIKGYTHDGEFVLIAEDGASDLTNYPVLYVSGKVWVNNHAHVIQGIAGKAKTKYLSYALKTVDFVQVLVGGTRAKLNGSVAKAIKVKIPQDIEEQTAIAALISDLDAEIDALTAKLNKVRNIKQGMMQELLTGRIRLLEQETEAVPVAVAKAVELPKREPETVAAQTGGHNQQFDDAVMIAGIVNALYSDKYPLGRKKVQKCLYLLRRHQDESTVAFKKKAAGPYADEVRYKGGEPIAQSAHYITTTTVKDKGTTFARGDKISQALGYIESWGKNGDIKWVAGKLKYKKVDDLELLATVDMAICDLEEAGTDVSVASIKHLIATNEEWKAKLKKQTFSDANIARAIRELQTLL